MLRVRLSVTLALMLLPSIVSSCAEPEDDSGPPLGTWDGGAQPTAGGATGATAGGTPGGVTPGGTPGGVTTGGTPGGVTTGGTPGGVTTGGTPGGVTTGGTPGGATTGATPGGATTGGTPGGATTGATPGGTTGGTPSGGTPGGGMAPIIPPVMGECPQLQAGTSTVTVNGTRVKLWVGAKKEGTGSFLAYFYGTGKIGSTADTMLPAAVRNAVTAEGGIVYAPEEAKNTGGDCSGTGTFGVDDFNTVDQMVACAVKNWGIDPKRIYATGCSAGGLTAGCLGIRRSNYIAAVAPNSGGITTNYGKLGSNRVPPAALTMNGGANDNVIVNFNDTSQYLDNALLKAGGFAVNCVHTGGHCGAPAALYQSAWQFLKDHPYGIKPSPYASGLPSGFHSTCQIFKMTDKMGFGGGI